MAEVADIFRLHGPEYLAKFGDRMLPSHIRAMRDIEACRTQTLGGQLYVCDTCEDYRYSYHSCKNRHCPKCGNHQAKNWLEEQSSVLLPVPYPALRDHLHAPPGTQTACALSSTGCLQYALLPPCGIRSAFETGARPTIHRRPARHGWSAPYRRVRSTSSAMGLARSSTIRTFTLS